VPIVLKSGRLNLLEPSGPVKACNGIALPFISRNLYRSQGGDHMEHIQIENGIIVNGNIKINYVRM
jgi:hypothetical protein